MDGDERLALPHEVGTRQMTLDASLDVVGRARTALTAPGAYFEIETADVRGNRLPVFRHRPRSLRELLETSVHFRDRLYLVEGDLRLTFGEHLELVDRLAARLRDEHGIRPGDRVALCAANRWEWVVAFWAIVSAGGLPCAFNGHWTPDEIGHATSLATPRLILADTKRIARIAESGWTNAVLDLDVVRSLVGRTDDVRPIALEVGEDDPALLIFTSGTTGRSRAVTTSHRGICGFVQVASLSATVARVAMGGEPPKPGEPLPPGDDVVLVTSPLFHLSMLYGVVISAVVRGTTAVLLSGRFDPERVLATIERERVTSWLALGSAAPRVCSLPSRGRFDTSSLRHVGIGGAPVSPTVQAAIRETFPRVTRSISMGYASTESVSVVAAIAGDDLIAHPTSTGRTVATVELELRDEDGRVVADGELGEVHVRSAYIMLGYWNDPEASAAVLKPEGWLAMGDLGRVIDGRLHLDSRARDMMLVSAENVSPTEVEHCLEAFPGVVEAAVFAVDDALTGDAVCAVVVVHPAAPVATDELDAFCRERLAAYKVPTHWHVVDERLPRTASGKLVKHEIRRVVGAGER